MDKINELNELIELTDAELDAVAAGQDTFIGAQNNNSTINGGQFNSGRDFTFSGNYNP
jgi:hypothetical protein